MARVAETSPHPPRPFGAATEVWASSLELTAISQALYQKLHEVTKYTDGYGSKLGTSIIGWLILN